MFFASNRRRKNALIGPASKFAQHLSFVNCRFSPQTTSRIPPHFEKSRFVVFRFFFSFLALSNSKFLAQLASSIQKPENDEEDDISILVTNNMQVDSLVSKSNIEILPNELLLNMFVFLGNQNFEASLLIKIDYKSLCRIAQVSRRFRDMTDTDPLWEILYNNTWSLKKRPQVQFDWKDTFRGNP
jgi:hypothetical protein